MDGMPRRTPLSGWRASNCDVSNRLKLGQAFPKSTNSRRAQRWSPNLDDLGPHAMSCRKHCSATIADPRFVLRAPLGSESNQGQRWGCDTASICGQLRGRSGFRLGSIHGQLWVGHDRGATQSVDSETTSGVDPRVTRSRFGADPMSMCGQSGADPRSN